MTDLPDLASCVLSEGTDDWVALLSVAQWARAEMGAETYSEEVVELTIGTVELLLLRRGLVEIGDLTNGPFAA